VLFVELGGTGGVDYYSTVYGRPSGAKLSCVSFIHEGSLWLLIPVALFLVHYLCCVHIVCFM